MRKTGIPKWGELVIVRILKINPHSATADLIEYKRTGYIQAVEVAKKWVRNISEFLKEGQFVVCRVLRSDQNNIDLSVKRVAREEANRKLTAFKRETRFEKLFEVVAKEFGKDLETAYREVGFDLQENFGSIEKAFEIAWKNPELLKERIDKKEWVEKLIDVSNKTFTEKTHEMKSNLKLISYSSNGLNVIKNSLSKANKSDFEVRYMSAPSYQIIGKGKDIKKLRASLEQVSEEIVKEVNKHRGDCSFSIEGKH